MVSVVSMVIIMQSILIRNGIHKELTARFKTIGGGLGESLLGGIAAPPPYPLFDM